ncbi:MAG: NAD(P)-dependent alcohol dehydrogenase [Anaerolinea sp.]|nr:NAD(P)-dependent alcohol dehydrogenase [Anaerolinea sp.]
MKAVLWTAYGSPDVLQRAEVKKPVPGDNEVLIKIHATTAPSGDCEMRSLNKMRWYTLPVRAYVGLLKPIRITILGMELAGEIEAVGKAVKRFKVGDQVFAETGFIHTGTYAEYIVLPEEPKGGALVIKPVNMTYEEAAAVPVGGLEALGFLRQGNIQRGQKILMNGAGGTIGTFAVQLAKHFGAEVTGVDSTDKLDMIRSIGADHVMDYTREDFTKSGERYDFILDIAGKSPFSGSLRSLKPNGCYLIVNPRLSQRIRGRWASRTGSPKVMFGAVYPRTEDLNFLRELIERVKLKTVIDRRYDLEQAAEAHRYVETGLKKGHVVITVTPRGET